MPKHWTAQRREKERKKLEGSAQWKTAQQESPSVGQEEDVEQGSPKRPRRKVKPSSKIMESGSAAATPHIFSGVGTGSSASVTASRAPTNSTGVSSGSAGVPARRSKGKRKRSHVSVLGDEEDDEADEEASTAAVSSRGAGGSSNGGGKKNNVAKKKAVKKKTVAKTKKPAVVKRKPRKKGTVAAVKRRPKNKGIVVSDAEQGSPSSLADHNDSASVLAPPVLDTQKFAEAPVIEFETESAGKKSDISLGVSILANAAGMRDGLLVQPAEETAADIAADIAAPPPFPDAGEVEAGDESMGAAGILFSFAQGAKAEVAAEDRAAAAFLFSLAGGRDAGDHEAVAQVDQAREGEGGAGGYRAEAMGEWEDDEL